MSWLGRERALKAINLEETDRIPTWDGVSGIHHPKFVKKISGLDLYKKPRECLLRVVERLDLDVVGGIPPSTLERMDFKSGEVKWKKGVACSEWGLSSTQWAETRYDWTRHESVNKVLEYDPQEHDPTGVYSSVASRSIEDLAEEYQTEYQMGQHFWGDRAAVSCSFYHTLFTWAIETFGYKMFMLTAIREPERFGDLLSRYAQEVSTKVFEAWSMVEDLPFFSSHDDICVTTGPVFKPKWYRKYIFPWYKRLWAPIKKNGIKVIFRSDGNLDEFVDDIVACGADGFHLRSQSNLERAVEKYGDSKIIIGNIDTNVLTFGGREEIKEEVKRCVSVAGHCPGYFFQVAGAIIHNIPLENVETYYKAIRKYGFRYRRIS